MNRRVVSRFETAIIYFLIVFLMFTLQAFSGTLDPTFGTGGKLTTDFTFSTSSSRTSFGYNIFLQPSGRIVGMGIHRLPGPDGMAPGVAAVGLTSVGDVDTTYSGGKTLEWDQITSISLSDVQMLPDGRLLRLSQYFSISQQIAKLIRTNADGSVDTGFTPNLSIGSAVPYVPYELSILSSGKILVLLEHPSSPYHLYLIRLNADGSRDATFGAGGAKELTLPSYQQQNAIPFGMEILPNGKILIAGGLNYSLQSNDFEQVYVARLDQNGDIDHSFGRLGIVRQWLGQRTYPTDLVIQPDGKYLICGAIKNTNRDSFMARFTPRGRPDGMLGTAGKVVTDFFVAGDDFFNAVAISNDGKIIVVGQSPLAPSTFSNFLVARYALGGTLEAHTLTPFTPSSNSPALNVLVQTDGKILVIGYTKNPNTSVNGNVFAMARYTSITND